MQPLLNQNTLNSEWKLLKKMEVQNNEPAFTVYVVMEGTDAYESPSEYDAFLTEEEAQKWLEKWESSHRSFRGESNMWIKEVSVYHKATDSDIHLWKQ